MSKPNRSYSIKLCVNTECTLAWEHEDQQLEVKVVWGPGCGLMLRDRGNDRDVVLGIGGVQQGVETTSPWRDLTWRKYSRSVMVQRKITYNQFLTKGRSEANTFKRFVHPLFIYMPVSLFVRHVATLTCQHENSAHRQQEEAHQGNYALEQHLKLLSIEFAAQIVHKGMNLAQAKHTESCHVLWWLHWLVWERRDGWTVRHNKLNMWHWRCRLWSRGCFDLDHWGMQLMWY